MNHTSMGSVDGIRGCRNSCFCLNSNSWNSAMVSASWDNSTKANASISEALGKNLQ